MPPEELYVYRESLEDHLDKLSKDELLQMFKYALTMVGLSDAVTTNLMFKYIGAQKTQEEQENLKKELIKMRKSHPKSRVNISDVTLALRSCTPEMPHKLITSRTPF